jgi:hypothetical protein
MEGAPPQPHSKARTMTHEEVAAIMKDPEKKPGKDYIVVDVRRTDFEVISYLLSGILIVG